MRVGVSLPTVGPAAEGEFVLRVARTADRLGLHSVWTTDHVLLPAHRQSRYPYPESTTELAFSPGITWMDPVAVMGFAAAATERVVIGTSVLVLPYRHPVVLANEVATVDRLSEERSARSGARSGRVVLGVGVGWMDEEFEALGVPKRERGARTDEYIRALRVLWSSTGPCSFEGRFVSFRDIELATRPSSPGGPPIYVGGNSEPALRRALALGDGWLGFEVFLEDLPEVRASMDRLGKEVGRDPTELVLSVRRGLVPPFEVTDFLPGRRAVSGSPREVADELRRYEDLGVSLVVFDLAMIPREMAATLEWLAAEVLPLLEG